MIDFSNPNSRAIIAIIGAVTAMGLSLSTSIPLVSIQLEQRGESEVIIGIMGAVPALAFIFASPVIPRVANFFGAGTLLWISLALCCFSIFFLGVSDNLYFWFFLRGMIGIGMSVLFLISETWINQVAEEKNRGSIVGIYVAAMTTGFALGPVLISLMGTEGSIPFYTSSVIVGAAGLLFLATGGNYPTLAGHSKFSVLSFIVIAPLICAAGLLVAFFDGAVLTFLPIYGKKHGIDIETAVLMSSVILAGNILLQVPIGWLADRYGREKLILICGALGLIGAILLPVLITDTFFLWPMLALWGGAVVGTWTIAMTLLGQKFEGAELVTANATLGVLWGVGSLLGPLTTGVSMDKLGPDGMPYVFIFICAVFVVITLWTVAGTMRQRKFSN